MKQAQRKQPVVSVDNARRSDYPAAGAGPAHHADRLRWLRELTQRLLPPLLGLGVLLLAAAGGDA